MCLFLLPPRRFVSDWVYSGVFRDVYGEFMIQVNEEYLGFRGETSHILGYINRLVQSADSDNEKKAGFFFNFFLKKVFILPLLPDYCMSCSDRIITSG